MINLISCVTIYKNKLAIGKNGNLLFQLKNDMLFFKNITTNQLHINSKLDTNIVLMGRKTYFSIPTQYRPLKNRINIILTRDPTLIKISPLTENITTTKNVYYTDLQTFYKFYNKYSPNVYVIGGSEIYNEFITKADTLYITHVTTTSGKNLTFDNTTEPDTFFNHFNSNFKLIGYSQKYTETNTTFNTDLSYRILYYKQSTKHLTEEHKYLDLLQNIIHNGNTRDDRTGTGTISTFGTQLQLDISNCIPLLTTKYVPFKSIVEELLWFCRGDTDSKILQDKGINIWKGNTSREFLDNRNLQHYPEGTLGPGYGWQIRHQGAKYSSIFSNTSIIDKSLIGGFDQLKYIENELKTNPFSRRIMMSYWNPSDFDKTALLPCFTENTLVLTNRGYIQIQNVLTSDLLFTHTGQWQKILKSHKKQINTDTITFNINTHPISINTTPEHPFYVRHINNIRSTPFWIKAKDLDSSYVMCTPINKQNNLYYDKFDTIIDIDDNLHSKWYTLGYIIKHTEQCNKNPNSLNIFIHTNSNIYNTLSNITHLQYVRENYYTCKKKGLFSLFEKNQVIPEWIQNAPKEYLRCFLKGFHSNEFSNEIDFFNNNIYRYVDNIHTAYSLQRIYAKLGYILHITQSKQHYKLHISGIIPKNELYINHTITNITNITHNKSIQQYVYNFEVENDNSYIVENIIAHNCHYSIQFYVEEKHGLKYLSGHFNMRSTDTFLGLPFNLVSYTILVYILAKKCNMVPDKLIYTGGDTHIYKNHLTQINEQLTRTPRPLPKLLLNNSLKYKDWHNITINDFELIGYFPDKTIKATMAI